MENHKIYIVGIGPGDSGALTPQAREALEASDVIVGYPLYLELLGEAFQHKELLSTPMRQERERCRMCFETAAGGKSVAMVSSGDAGIYGMASLMYEIQEQEREAYGRYELEVIPGITAASSGAALLGAPINHDFCAISLSDLLTPWELIARRLEYAARADFCMVIYNPASRKRADYLQKACAILREAGVPGDRACGYVENIGREGARSRVCSLEELEKARVNMFTTVFIGSSRTRIMGDKLVTPRGYTI